jgi:hypothetical protein
MLRKVNAACEESAGRGLEPRPAHRSLQERYFSSVAQYVESGPNGPPHCVVCWN